LVASSETDGTNSSWGLLADSGGGDEVSIRMLSRRLYYTLKPFLPWRLRMAARGAVARRKRVHVEGIWPINEAAGRVPPEWKGWPNQKKFAFVITHDVEGPEGLAKCRPLAELEMSMGFRSSFNFIPEGSYSVPAELRAWLVGHGFEVGIHDLHHDGKLYHSRTSFRRKAAHINHYIKEWHASGFRSGFMLRQLDWIHDLDITYDASTFDTDPFEPQPDAAGTIFPYWIPSGEDAAGQGYVELPYTLPQDSTLFLVLKERSSAIWLRKVDWIAERGGMALVNVHPDYIDFNGTGNSRTFDVGAYCSLLRHLAGNHAHNYWHVTARELAVWYKKETVPFVPEKIRNVPATNLRGKRAAVLLYSTYPADPRPRRAAEAMVEANMSVDLFCLAEEQTDRHEETIKGVRVTRLPLKRKRGGKWSYFWQYGRFLAAAFWFVTTRDLQRKYDVIHVHNMPDFLVFAAILPKLRGASVILDLHDPMPELMMSIYGVASNHRMVRLLRFLERQSIRLADLVLTPNLTFKELFVGRGCPQRKIEIVMNSPRPDIFDAESAHAHITTTPSTSPLRVMHHGLIAERHGVDLLVEAVALVRTRIPTVELHIYGGRTPFLDTVLERADSLGIRDAVTYHGPKSQEDIAEAIREADVGVVPNRRSSFTELNFPTRLFEYLSMRCPVIAPSTRGIRDYFSEEQMLYFAPNDVTGLAERIAWVLEHSTESQKFVERGLEVYRHHFWPDEKANFIRSVAVVTN
jgi:glycosyltransferase involved in cell wall biosynthesis